jgi:hypothetical protein
MEQTVLLPNSRKSNHVYIPFLSGIKEISRIIPEAKITPAQQPDFVLKFLYTNPKEAATSL